MSTYQFNAEATRDRLVELIRKKLKFDSLKFQELDDLLEAIDVDPCKLCTYCWNGKE